MNEHFGNRTNPLCVQYEQEKKIKVSKNYFNVHMGTWV